jgi:hypothetical protein
VDVAAMAERGVPSRHDGSGSGAAVVDVFVDSLFVVVVVVDVVAEDAEAYCSSWCGQAVATAVVAAARGAAPLVVVTRAVNVAKTVADSHRVGASSFCPCRWTDVDVDVDVVPLLRLNEAMAAVAEVVVDSDCCARGCSRNRSHGVDRSW